MGPQHSYFNHASCKGGGPLVPTTLQSQLPYMIPRIDLHDISQMLLLLSLTISLFTVPSHSSTTRPRRLHFIDCLQTPATNIKMKLISTVVLAFVALIAAAPTGPFDDFPECARPAMAAAVAMSGCSASDLACVCEPDTFGMIKANAAPGVVLSCGLAVAKGKNFAPSLSRSIQLCAWILPFMSASRGEHC